MAGAIVKKAFEVADKVSEELGLFVVDIEYVKEGKDRILRIFIDDPEGVGIDECESFSRAFEEKFDPLDAIDEAYTLEVSSPGVDRILKTEREFLHYIGRKVSIKLYKPIEEKKEFDAVLIGYEGGCAVIDAGGKEMKIPVKDAAYIRLFFSI